MRIVSYRGPHHGRIVEHVDLPVDPARVALLGGDSIIISLLTDRAEWRVTLTARDVSVLGGALEQITTKGSR
jgi:hypothetical protein